MNLIFQDWRAQGDPGEGRGGLGVKPSGGVLGGVFWGVSGVGVPGALQSHQSQNDTNTKKIYHYNFDISRLKSGWGILDRPPSIFSAL